MNLSIFHGDLVRHFSRRYRSNLIVIVVASSFVNVLTFGGSLYMMLVYDSVLPSRSIPTLLGLFAMLAFLYLIQGVLEAIRSDSLLGLADGVHNDLFDSVHHSAVSRTLQTQRDAEGLQLTRDLDLVHGFLASAAPLAFIDLPWVVVFLVVLTMLHWALGLTALLGTLVLIALAWWTNRRSQEVTKDLTSFNAQRLNASQVELRFAETALALGMHERLRARSRKLDRTSIGMQGALSRTVSRLGGAGRLFRLFLQSAMLTVGALLLIDGKASGGIILAASILSGRALAPIDQAIAGSRSLSSARAGWARIVEALRAHPRTASRSVALQSPSRGVAARDLWVVPPGSQTPALAGVTLTLEPGQALAIVGPSAAGKSTLAKALLGIWPAARGEVRLDGAKHDQWDRAKLGASLGYLPQSIELLEGTIAQNIARFDPVATSQAVLAAAAAAGIHETILALQDGYDTPVSPGGGELSAGQRQRLALARALYGDPFLVVLDEPNSNLDAAGDAALSEAIVRVRRRGGIVVMVTHRPATLGPISHVAVLSAGRLTDFGPRDEVLKRSARTSQPEIDTGASDPRLQDVRQ